MSTTEANQMMDEELLRLWCIGDKSAGNRLVTRYLPTVYKFFCNKVGDKEDLADLVNQTFMACAEHKERLAERGTVRSAVITTARHVLYAYVRKQNRYAREDEEFESTSIFESFPRSVSSIVGLRRETQRLVEGLRRIPIADQVVLELRYFSELDATKIGEVLGVPAATARGRLMRARTRLRHAIEELNGWSTCQELSEAEQFEAIERWATELQQELASLERRTS